MNGVTSEEITAARQVDLLSYLQTHEPQEIVRVGSHEYRTRTHDSLRISDNGMWNWCSRGFGGKNALDYLVRVKGIPFISAVRELCGEHQQFVHCEQEIPITPLSEREEKIFALPKKDKNNAAVMKYLCGRGIHETILAFCFEQGVVYQTDHKGYKNCVFVGVDEENAPRYACVRGCNGNFRGDVPASQKQYGFCIPAGNRDAVRVEVYESPIDALSGASLRAWAGRDWRTVHYLALGGLNYLALDHFLQAHPKVKMLQLCLDNDERGRAFAKKLAGKHREQGYEVKDLIPPKGKDVNEYLQMKRRLLHQQKQQEERQ